ncbi:hypothetical protein PWEIH_00545 [Listeria weihenstephanensis FSL R9-0317]|uniref:Uncharacterized protein n=1 Tax=Listeria weihenstephanensis TaxID=1006155 RepID=A0A3B6XG98_9LIST|nr:hypothetical protein [Listeria weihenstephanensis]AQY50489.1 hypothetical protein UE46_05240 [Listeria phage LWP01] [Listeria weihenstephanensis]AQY52633.1 hypothetical protein UE46_p05240 [Listeria phage LWP01]EUJ41507.1 hypothetical protein PWEIH_00545 [Listeria weihenstephanensis FSL R9-0317]
MNEQEKKLSLILSMKRCIEILEMDDIVKDFPEYNYGKTQYGHGKAELKAKLREVRRDSVRLFREEHNR